MTTSIPIPGVPARRRTRRAAIAPLPWLVASIAHELSQPLTAIVSDACASRHRLAAADLDLVEIRASLDAIVRDAERAGEVLARIRMLAAQTSPAFACCALDAVVRDAVALTHGELARCSIDLVVEVASSLPRPRIDAGGLRQVLGNLLHNAIDACRGLLADRRRIIVRAHARERGSLCIEVEDAGIGIDGDPERLFEPYFTTKPAGSGIGLPLGRAIVRRCGGDLRCGRTRGPGAIFEVTLPCEPAPAHGHTVAAGRHSRRRAW